VINCSRTPLRSGTKSKEQGVSLILSDTLGDRDTGEGESRNAATL
jgi:hypothetical protein